MSRISIESMRIAARDIEAKIKETQEKTQKECKHRKFFAEDDGDCHSRGWYYTCADCGYLTRFKPAKTVDIVYQE